MYQWAEDDLILPEGMFFLDFSAPIGKTFVMYHGTSRENAASILASGFLRSDDGMLGPGIYLSRKLKKARYYPVDHPEHDKVVIKVSVNVGRVIPINHKGHPRQKNWHDPGYGQVYDTAWIPPGSRMVNSSLEMDCVWDPNRIKILGVIEPHPAQPGYGNGYGNGCEYGYGHGNGLEYGHGHGHGNGREYGYGYGNGLAYGHGHGNGYGHGYGYGHGSGYGHGYGHGHGNGREYGYGYGNRLEYGHGHGNGYGHGNGREYGYGYGNGRGYGYDDGARGYM